MTNRRNAAEPGREAFVAIEIAPLSAALGAEVRGVDLRRPLADEAIDVIRDAWHRHIVLLFRGQELSPKAQIAFAEKFGVVGRRSRPVARRGAEEALDARLMLISNIRRDGQPIGSLPDGEMFFHHDGCHAAEPYWGTFLYAIEVPSQGGNTCFANMCRAWESLPADIKAKIAGLQALHAYDYGVSERLDPERDFSGVPHHVHPVVIRHPLTGRPALYVNRLMTVRIVGLPIAESNALLERLFAAGEDPANVYEHVWRPGDLVMWDNFASMHARTDFPSTERRLLRRCAVGRQPVGAYAAA
jgi:taurine dioxygenase